MAALKQRASEATQDERRPATVEPGAQRGELAGYIAQMPRQMAAMARGEKLDLLAYFHDMARIEAATQADRDKAA